MIGLVVIGYDVLPEAILIALQCTTGKQEQIIAVPLASDENADDQRQAILNAINHVNTGDGVLVFTDSAGSTAGHLSLSIINQADVDVISGVNLPMLSKVVEKRNSLSAEELAELARDEGRKGITWRTP
ncbi:MAG: hypothetical protein KAJ29_04400 [Alphaproteobacteria bacterium]|nr:hypothetical protein [Alphaproteobacteria bacterium]